MSKQVKNPKQALSPAFLKQKPKREQIDRFKSEFIKLCDRINERESEEYNKNLVTAFLNDVYYKDKHFINTSGRADLVVHNGKDTNSPVGVLIETKSPASNKTEMVSRENLNVKSFQQLVLYYLRERKTNKNFELRYLIITNVYEWFVFDAQEFEKLFYQNKKLLKDFEQFESGSLTDTKTDFFYKEIATPVIEELKNEIFHTYFDIRHYDKIVRSTDKENDKSLVALYQFLSPNNLLKIPFEQDANSLNAEFYAELLHILGLVEIKRGGQKFIERKKVGERDNASMLENAIEIIERRDLLDKIDRQQLGDTREEQLFALALNLTITWINRILFLKLLEAQIIKYNKSKDFAFLTPEILPNYGEVERLFFDILAKKQDDRRTELKEKFTHVPYLNSSLFEMTDYESSGGFIAGLDNNVEQNLYSRSVLHERGKEKMRPLEYLLRFLDAYDFNNESSEDIQDENKALISASVLGLIFEKINGYKDGSFFTPAFITMYMCRETISRAVIQKFNEAKSWNCQSIDDLYNKIDDRKEANAIFNQIRICDPAVGSGHFLVSALNEMIYLKSELGILIDDNGKRLRDYNIIIENDELVITDEDGNLFNYNPNNKESQRIQELLFREKQTIIENCLFGVDINPNSVKICQLRLWIELLKNTYYRTGTKELETLPNIDINIKCGNSLISRFALDADLKPVLKRSKLKISDYQNAVSAYRSADSKEQKREMNQLIDRIKNDFRTEISQNDTRVKKLYEWKRELSDLTAPDLFEWSKKEKAEKNKQIAKLETDIAKRETEIEEIKNNRLYINALEWRFEFPEVLNDEGDFVGFDCVIGNPPYGLFNKKQNQKVALSTEESALRIIKQNFPEAIGGMVNAERIFYAFGLSICRKNGIVNMIIPFGVLTDTTSANLRKHIFANHTLLKVDAFPERDSIKRRVFDEAKMSTAIIVSQKTKTDKSFDLGISYEKAISTERSIFNPKDLLQFNADLAQIPLTNSQSFNLLLQIYENSSCKLGEISQCLTGEIDMTLGKNALTTDDSSPILVKGVQLDRFVLKTKQDEISQGIIEYVDLEKVKDVISSKKFSDISQKRIALQGLTGVNERRRLKATIIDNDTFLANSCNYILESPSYKLEFVLALFNSNLYNLVFKTLSTSSNVNGYEADNLPFVEISADKQKPFVNLVNSILYLKNKESQQLFTHTSNERVASHIEEVLDMMVYELYFEEHMKEVGLDVFQFIYSKSMKDSKCEEERAEIIKDFYLWYQKPENPVRQRMLLIDTRSKDIISVINKSV
jgi:Alw26I/Eco31I/Esp3I family type II restriction m6 adenine DNA methyltransferase